MALNLKGIESIFISRTSALVFASIGLILGSIAYFRFKNPTVVAAPVVVKDSRDPLEIERERNLMKVTELLAKKQFKAAQEILVEVLKEAPTNPFALSSMAMAEKRMGQFEQAEMHLRAAISFDGGQWVLHHNLGILLFDKGKPDEALQSFAKALELSPKNNQILLSQARVLELTGKFTAARASYGQALDAGLDPGAADTIKVRLKQLDVLAYIERGDK